MKHPILSGSGLKFYLLVWGVLVLIHASVLYFYLDFRLTIAIADSLTYNTFFAIMANGLWYVVKFASLNKDELGVIAVHVAAASITLFLWTTASSLLLQLLIKQPSYYQFIQEAAVWRWIIGVMFYCITVLIFYLINYYRTTQERINRELELQNLLKDTELRMLKSQINPHFIFNSLNSINALTVSAPDQAQEMVIKLSEFLRYSLGKESSDMNSVKDEIQNTVLYLDIERVRFGDRLQFTTQVPEAAKAIQVPNLILQPLIENAIKYGVYDTLEEVQIKLNAELTQDLLHLSVSNSYDEKATKAGAGIGLNNVQKRLKLVYGRSDLLTSKRLNGAFVATVKIPISKSTSDEQD